MTPHPHRYRSRDKVFVLLLASPLLAASCGELKDPTDPAPTSSALDVAFGRWDPGAPSFGSGDGFIPIHSSLMRNDTILGVAGSSFNTCYSWGRHNTKVFSLTGFTGLPGSWTGNLSGPYLDLIPQPCENQEPGFTNHLAVIADAFCSGHVHDDQGRVIFQGGLRGYDGSDGSSCNGTGVPNAAAYTPGTTAINGSFSVRGRTNPHWYPTLVAGVKSTYIFPGVDSDNTGGPDAGRISWLPYGAFDWQGATTGPIQTTLATYPRVHLLPYGKFFVSSPDQGTRQNEFYNPLTNFFESAGSSRVPTNVGGALADGLNIHDSWTGTAVLLPLSPVSGIYLKPTVAIFNDKTAYSRELGLGNVTGWKPLPARPASMANKVRNHGSSTILPTGQILLTGGSNSRLDFDGVKEAEIYDPSLLQWQVSAAASFPRNYHSVALLMRDGRVWTAGGNKDAVGSDTMSGTLCDGMKDGMPNTSQPGVEVFTPWYYDFPAERPTLTTCPAKVAADGGDITIGIGGSQGNNIKKVALMRAGSVTHAFDSDQRLIWLDIKSTTASTVKVATPYGAAAAPPGDYMLFALKDRNNGSTWQRYIPSVGCWMTVEVPVARNGIAAADMNTVMAGIINQGYKPTNIDGYEIGSQTFFNVTFKSSQGDNNWSASWGLTQGGFNSEFSTRVSAGMRLKQIDSYKFGGVVNYAVIFEPDDHTVEWRAFTATSQTGLDTLWNTYTAAGFRPIMWSHVWTNSTTPVFSGIFETSTVSSWSAWWGMGEAEFQAKIDAETAAGRHLDHVAASNIGTNTPRFAATFSNASIGRFRAAHMLSGADFQKGHDDAISQSEQPRVIAGYGVGSNTKYAALWSEKK